MPGSLTHFNVHVEINMKYIFLVSFPHPAFYLNENRIKAILFYFVKTKFDIEWKCIVIGYSMLAGWFVEENTFLFYYDKNCYISFVA